MFSTLKILDTISITVFDSDSVEHIYKSKVSNIPKSDIIHIMAPFDENRKPVLFERGLHYDMHIQSKNGITLWHVEFIGLGKDGNFRTCHFRGLKGPIKTQRREFYRQPVSIDFKFRILSVDTTHDDSDFDKDIEELINEISKELIYKGKLLDLSGGGCAFNSDLFLPLQSTIKLSFIFRNTQFEFETCILNRTSLDDTNAKWQYMYRAKFQNAKPKTVDNLVNLIFAEQRDELFKKRHQISDNFSI